MSNTKAIDPAGYYKDKPLPTPSGIALTKRGLADDLVMQATALLSMAARLRGDMPSMPMPAEFQALDIMRNDLDRRITQYRAVIGNVD